MSQDYQVSKLSLEAVDLINVYRSALGNSSALLNNLQEMIDLEKPSLITGDFNIYYKKNSNHKLVKGLKEIGFKQLVTEATHIKGGHLDHAYWYNPNQFWDGAVLERYTPYYTDHD